MRLVVADTGPINYLVLIDAIEVLPKTVRAGLGAGRGL
jgi:hypothetical protein